ncbi:MAG: hypothetical protein K6G88_15695 [Lachnospiraceae bacterium]|nr:hypothetical protein [Lachnospiraceae bacterium]
MRNIYKVTCAMMVIGALTVGIGCGVAFAEFSSFEYIGNKSLDSIRKVDKEIVYNVEKEDLVQEDDKEILWIDFADTSSEGYKCEIVEDESVQKNSLKIVGEYYAYTDTVYQWVHNTKYVFDDKSKIPCLQLGYQYNNTDMDAWFEMKDELLKDFKNRKIADYKEDKRIEKITIFINPKSDFELRQITDYYKDYEYKNIEDMYDEYYDEYEERYESGDEYEPEEGYESEEGDNSADGDDAEADSIEESQDISDGDVAENSEASDENEGNADNLNSDEKTDNADNLNSDENADDTDN